MLVARRVWMPFHAASLERVGRAARFCSKTFRVFESERPEGAKWKQDSMGDWRVCLPVSVAIEATVAPPEEVGIDLGLKRHREDARWRALGEDSIAAANRRSLRLSVGAISGKAPEPTARARQGQKPQDQGRELRTATIELRVADLDAEHQKLKKTADEFVQEPTTMPWGNRSLLFRDRDGKLINFFTPVSAEAIKKHSS